MTETAEIVRFTVHPDRREDFLRNRPQVLAAIRDRFPGLLEATLAEKEDGTWIDVLRWRSREEAEAAAAGHQEIEVCRSWMTAIDEIIEFAHAPVRDHLS